MPLLPIPLLPGGAFLDVGVGASRAWTGPDNRPRTWTALIDTGADVTAVSPAVLAALRPQPIGVQGIGRAAGPNVVLHSYDVRVRFGGHAAPGRWFNLEVVGARPATPGVDVLIGMDLLLGVDMVWAGAHRLLLLSH
jgi:hypothetical protein